jgi:monoamine oxidase
MRLLIIGAGAAGLMAGRELARAGKRVTILEARDRCGGRIVALPEAEFGYAAEGGPEFIHGAAPVTREVLRDAGLALLPRGGSRWMSRGGRLSRADPAMPHAAEFYRALDAVTEDLPIADFLEARFGEPKYDELRRRITRTVEGYDAADPRRASTIALREEWTAPDEGVHGRIADGYGAMTAYLADDCRRHGGEIRLGAAVASLEDTDGGVAARTEDGRVFSADAAVLAVPLPLLDEIALPAAAAERAVLAADIGFGNVIKLLFRFSAKWWVDAGGSRDLSDLSFVLADAAVPVPTWWTQYPADYPVLTGWCAGPRTERVAALDEPALIEMGLASLAEIFALPADRVRRDLVAARALNWGNDRFARGAYSYATPQTRAAVATLRQPCGTIFFSGEALYDGPNMGTVEAALASGRDTARLILGGAPPA